MCRRPWCEVSAQRPGNDIMARRPALGAPKIAPSLLRSGWYACPRRATIWGKRSANPPFLAPPYPVRSSSPGRYLGPDISRAARRVACTRSTPSPQPLPPSNPPTIGHHTARLCQLRQKLHFRLASWLPHKCTLVQSLIISEAASTREQKRYRINAYPGRGP